MTRGPLHSGGDCYGLCPTSPAPSLFSISHSNRLLAISQHPNHLQIIIDKQYQYAIIVSLSRHHPSACPPKEGALRTMLARHAVPPTSITLRFVSASHFGTHLISSISLSFHTLTGTPFCNPFVFMVFHLMGGCTSLCGYSVFEGRDHNILLTGVWPHTIPGHDL